MAEWISAGAIKKEVSQIIGISVMTVENTARRVYAKLGIRNVGQLATWYYHHRYNIPLKKIPSPEEIRRIERLRKRRCL